MAHAGRRTDLGAKLSALILDLLLKLCDLGKLLKVSVFLFFLYVRLG